MKMQKFLEEFPRILATDNGDNQFETLRILTGGMSTARVGKLLNFAVSCMENESYLEIGTYTGYTLIAAAYQSNRGCVGIDNFRFEFPADPNWVKTKLQENMERFTGNYAFIENDFRKVKDINGQKIGVAFIDGNHTAKDVLDAFNWLEPHLADRAIIVVDDIRIAGSHLAVLDRQLNFPEYSLLFWCIPAIMEEDGRRFDPYFDNGLAVLKYERSKTL